MGRKSAPCSAGREIARHRQRLFKTQPGSYPAEGKPLRRVCRAQQQQQSLLLLPQQVQEFPQLQPQLLLQLQLQGLQELLQELQQLFPLPPQHPSRMMIRMIHRQLLFPLFHMFCSPHSFVTGISYVRNGQKAAWPKKIF